MANEIIYSSNPLNIPVGIGTLASFFSNDYIPTAGETGVLNDGTYGILPLIPAYQLIFTMTYGLKIVWTYDNFTDRDNAYSFIISTYGYSPESH